MPKITVIVPVYKVEPYLDRCVESILAQTFSDFELILVDDGSPDNCPKMCDEWAKKDNRIIVIHKENGGLSDARNSGIEWALANSNSEWLSFVDSDDKIPSDALQLLLDAVTINNTGAAIGGHTNEVEVIYNNSPVKNLSFEELYSIDNYAINVIMACGKLFKKSHWENVRFPVGKLHEDRFTIHKILFQSEIISIVYQTVYYYFQTDNSITRSKWTPRRLDDMEAIKEQLSFFKEKNFPNARLRVLKDKIFALETMLKEMKNVPLKYLKHKISLRFQMKVLLLKYKKTLGLSIKRNANLYEMAFPWIMKLYWNSKVLKRKLFKGKHNCGET